MELRPSLKMGKSKCAKSPISYLTTAPPEFETFKLLLMAVALPYSGTCLNMRDAPEPNFGELRRAESFAQQDDCVQFSQICITQYVDGNHIAVK